MSHSNEHIFHETELHFRITTTPTAQESALQFLLSNAGESFTESQVRDAIEAPRTTTHVALSALASQGLVVTQRVGRSGLYSVNLRDPLVRQLKIARSLYRVQSALRPVEDAIDLAVLFGSAARGQDGGSSDIDVLVVTSETDRVLDELAPHGWMQPVVLSPGQHMKLIADNATLISESDDGIRIMERR